MKINKHIVIARSSIESLTSMNLTSGNALAALLALHYERVSVCIVNNLQGLEALLELKPDLVFLGVRNIPTPGKDKASGDSYIWLSEYLDSNGILYTGSGTFAHKLENNKAAAKQQVLDVGLNTSAFFVAGLNLPIDNRDALLTFPLFVKPLDRGGGTGIDSLSVVHNKIQLEHKVNSITQKYHSDSLVEEFLEGREFSVAIMQKKDSSDYYAMTLELVAPEDEFGFRILSGSVKDQDTETFSAVMNEQLNDKLSLLATKVFIAIGARDYGRIDIRLDSVGEPQFLEANLIPSLIEGFGNFPKACLMNENFEYESIILQIVDLAFARSKLLTVN